MELGNINSDVALELLIVISCFDSDIISKIPSDFLKELNDLAADSTKEFYLLKNKQLKDQNLSSNCQDLLALVYYTYLSDNLTKEQLFDTWVKNEQNFEA